MSFIPLSSSFFSDLKKFIQIVVIEYKTTTVQKLNVQIILCLSDELINEA